MGRHKTEWQDREYVLWWFGKKEGEARKSYCGYVKAGIEQGSRRKCISETRWQIAVRLVEEYGFSMAEAARLLGVTTSGISKIMKRIENQ